MPSPTILVATWGNGVCSVTGTKVRRELAFQSVRSLVADRRGGVLAIVGGHSLRRRAADGVWRELATSEASLSSCVPIGNAVFVGTEDARVLRVDPDGAPQFLTGFDAVAGRDTWYAGSAIVNGKRMGPPLGVRSMSATCDGAVLLVNVHVGGIPRSTDGGLTWQPTIAVDTDVHQVLAHPARPDIVIAAAAAGLCVSRDAGITWTIETRGLHASYCSAVAFGRDDILVAASSDHFANDGAVYRRPRDGDDPLGMALRVDGIADTECIATRDSIVAVVDRAGRLHVSQDDGGSWSSPVDGLTGAGSLHIC